MSATVVSLSRRTSAEEPERLTDLRTSMIAARNATLARVAGLDDAALCAQPDPNFSPIGWHLGHIAYTEALWLNPGADPHPEWQHLFRQDGLAKVLRGNLPSRTALADYLSTVRDLTLARLDAGAAETSERLWRFIVQHEALHGETIAFLRRLANIDRAPPADFAAPRDLGAMIEVPAGAFFQGHDGTDALDNERSRHPVELGAFRISTAPVSQVLYWRFIEACGYLDRNLWSAEGWSWRIANDVLMPRYWVPGAGDLPVHGVSAYEAEAYCRWIGARLPSESEWERAALLGGDMLGQVWQWTSTLFAPYAGFEPYPYPGYSADYFDGRHRVLKGGSWATGTACLRPSFRNWYEPWTRQMFAGFRYAQDV
jgi:gamma-glutamyl hercynylcysteine S-oxide synthase